MARKKAKIGICHYRIGQTDGVSLEIAKRKTALEDMGHAVKLISGPRQTGADFIIRDLEFDLPKIKKIKENAFFGLNDFKDENDLLKHIYRVSNRIKNAFLRIQRKERFDHLFLHNIFTHGRHIAAAKAFAEIGQETDIRLIAVNHDFYETYDGLYTPQCKAVKTFLKKYVPPPSKEIRHVTINSLSQKLLYKKIARPSLLFPDTFDFEQPEWKLDGYNQNLAKEYGIRDNDLVVLQATRITGRKAIELAIGFAAALAERKAKLVGKPLYNGKILDDRSRVVFVLAGYVEPASREYWRKLQDLMNQKNLYYAHVAPVIGTERSQKGKKRHYSLWDAYAISDLATYPSVWEGFGNQFLEAVFAKKPLVLFEYPVYRADIKPQGYEFISLGSRFRKRNGLASIPDGRMENAAQRTISALLDQDTKNVLEMNFQIAKRHYGEKTLKGLLERCLE